MTFCTCLGNRLTILGPRDLAGLVNLQHLIVNNNQLIKVSTQAFDDFLLTLEDLDMSYNNLRRYAVVSAVITLCIHTIHNCPTRLETHNTTFKCLVSVTSLLKSFQEMSSKFGFEAQWKLYHPARVSKGRAQTAEAGSEGLKALEVESESILMRFRCSLGSD